MAGINRIVTGKRGAGKSLVAVGIATDYLKRGATVVTNLDIYTHNFENTQNKNIRIIRIPDIFTHDHLKNLPLGNPGLIWDETMDDYTPGPDFDEAKNGLVLLDEIGSSLNSRKWNAKGRDLIIHEMNMLRKYGYDTCLLAQDISMVDVQVRGSSGDEVGFCKRLDRVSVPLLSPFYKFFTGKPLKFPKIHFCTFRMGDNESAMKSETVKYTGRQYYKLYNTAQKFREDYPHEMHSVLTPWHLVGRYQEIPVPFWKRALLFGAKGCFLIAFVIGSVVPSTRKYFGMVRHG